MSLRCYSMPNRFINDELKGLKKGVFMKQYMCVICGFVYEEEKGWPEEGIEPGTKWDDVPSDWICPECAATKADFEMIEI